MEQSASPTISESVDLAPHTTINLGGPARYFITCQTVDEVRAALQHANDQSLPVHILGGGSNTIFADAGFPGLIIKIALTGTTFTPEENTVTVTAAAGEKWDTLVEQCVAKNLAGLEGLSGIPGLVGAAPMQNIGAYGQEVATTITRVTTLDRQTLAEKTFTNAECQFAYRTSRFKTTDKDRYLITSVTFTLTPNGPATTTYQQVTDELTAQGKDPAQATLADVRHTVLTLRRRKSMVIDPADPNTRSCGSFFLNPILRNTQFNELKQRSAADTIPSFPAGDNVKIPAAWLIEQAGFSKGERRDNIGISENHTLALVNHGGTTAELLSFAAEITQAVEQKFGIQLQREPVTVS